MGEVDHYWEEVDGLIEEGASTFVVKIADGTCRDEDVGWVNDVVSNDIGMLRGIDFVLIVVDIVVCS